MLLIELIQTSTQYKKAKKPYDLAKQKKLADIARLGDSNKTGAYGRVQHKQNDPFTVDKIPHEAKQNIELNDRYLYYIKSVKDSGIAESNPFFPRVYEYHVYTDKNGNQRYKVNMEKLQSISATSTEEIDMIIERIFKPDFLNKEIQYDKNAPIVHSTLNNKFKYFSDAMRKAFRAPSTAIADDKFYEAVMWLIEIKQSLMGGARFDVHMNNFMLRRTPAGSQLVITDPLA